MYEQAHDSHDLKTACDFFKEAASYLSSLPPTCFHHAQCWARTLVQYNATSSLTAYHTEIGLLPQLAALYLDLPSRQQILSTKIYSTFVSDAAACAVGLNQYNTAVEFLEVSRSIFWS
jgi:hypothetical protein